MSKNGKAYRRYDRLASHLAQLPVNDAILGADGKPLFWQMMRTSEVVFFAFDLIWLNGRDLRQEPWTTRRKLLDPLNREAKQFLVMDHILSHGKDLFAQVCAENLEGIVSKHGRSRYGKHWLNPKSALHADARQA